MKLIWTIILKSRTYSLLVLSFLAFGCKEKFNQNAPKKTEIPVRENYTTLCFVNKLNSDFLYNYKFGKSSNKEELPTKIIFDRDSLGLVDVPFIYINNYKLNVSDSIFGNFEKYGFKDKKFYINPRKQKQIIEIDPNPSELIFQAFNEEFKNEFDSIRLTINKRNEFEENKESNEIKEVFIFKPLHLSKDLSIFNLYIYPNQFLTLELEIFKKSNYHSLKYEIKYLPFTKTIIKVY